MRRPSDRVRIEFPQGFAPHLLHPLGEQHAPSASVNRMPLQRRSFNVRFSTWRNPMTMVCPRMNPSRTDRQEKHQQRRHRSPAKHPPQMGVEYPVLIDEKAGRRVAAHLARPLNGGTGVQPIAPKRGRSQGVEHPLTSPKADHYRVSAERIRAAYIKCGRTINGAPSRTRAPGLLPSFFDDPSAHPDTRTTSAPSSYAT